MLTNSPSFAGSDSTASTMQSFFFHVLSNKEVYAKLQEEIDQAAADGTIPSSGNIAWNEAQGLAYFQACLKEAMRMRPAVGLNITRVVPPEGAELDGHFFPGGVIVAVNGWVLHRDKATFGQDADQYRPERWLTDAEEARRMERAMAQVSCRLRVFILRAYGEKYADPCWYSSAVALMSALAATWLFWRSTKSFLDCCATTSSRWSDLATLKSMRRSLLCRRV